MLRRFRKRRLINSGNSKIEQEVDASQKISAKSFKLMNSLKNTSPPVPEPEIDIEEVE